jgi:hypothetical protein
MHSSAIFYLPGFDLVFDRDEFLPNQSAESLGLALAIGHRNFFDGESREIMESSGEHLKIIYRL